jgi:subtilisin family serine protease
MQSLFRRSSLVLLAAVAAVLAALTAPAAAPAAEGQIIVRYEPGADARDRSEARGAADVVRDEALPLARTELVTPESTTSVAEAIADLTRSGDVATAEPDARRYATRTPDDPGFTFEWGLSSIGLPTAWDTTTGDPGVTVAVVDTGVDPTHPDLTPNLWHNADEIPGDRIDNDSNGYVDDVRGWDFAGRGARTSPDDNDPADENGHGTHVAGTIGARGDDGIGIAGVSWNSTIMPVRALDADAGGWTSDLIKAYAYAQDNGARIVNLSLGGPTSDAAEYAAIQAAPEVLFVVAAGNGGEDGICDDNDFADDDPTERAYEESYPCEYNLPNVICVAATDSTDALADFSNYGPQTVDIAAPGVNIASTWLGGGWVYLDGTSMATPHVSGAAALVMAARSESPLTPWQVAQTLMDGADKAPALDGKVASGGRLNVAGALAAEPPSADLEPPIAPAAPQPVIARATPNPQAPSATPAQPTVSQPAPAPTAPPAAMPAPAPVGVPSGTAPARTSTTTPTRTTDRTAPTLRFTLPGRLRLRTVLSRGLRLPARCSERCTVRVAITVDGHTAKRAGLAKRSSAKVTVAKGTATVAGGAKRSVRVRFTTKARHALARLRSVRTAVRITATDAAGNDRTRSRRLTLSR